MTLICEREIVKDKDFIYNYDLEQWQLDKMKEYGKTQGWFKYKGFTFELKGLKQIHIPESDYDTIERPEVNITKQQGRTKFVFTDRTYKEVREIKKGLKIYIRYKDYDFPIDIFCTRAKMSAGFLKKKLVGIHSCKVNGHYIEVIPKPKNFIFYTITNNKTGKVYPNVLIESAINFLGCNRSLIGNLNKFYQSAEFGDFKIVRHEGMR